MHPYDRAMIEYEDRMWDEILRAELSLWARVKRWLNRVRFNG